MSERSIKLGENVKDSITGFNGKAVAKTEWLYGCIRIGVQSPNLDKDNKPLPVEWFDEAQLVLDDGNSGSSKTPAGPRDDPSRAKDPQR
jgi:hypothetical protein